MKDGQQIGRLALRVEGEWWIAYYARPETMNGAIPLARIRMDLVINPKRKEAFMGLMRESVAAIIEGATGGTVTWPDPPQRAPEHERAGRA